MLVVKPKGLICPSGVKLRIRGGRFTIVDPDLHEFLNKFKWFPLKSASTTYIVTRKIIKGKAHTIRLHRLILQAAAHMKVHHVDNDSFHNCRHNLREVTEREHRHFDGWHIFYR